MTNQVARSIKQRNRYVVEQIGSDGLARQLSKEMSHFFIRLSQILSVCPRILEADGFVYSFAAKIYKYLSI